MRRSSRLRQIAVLLALACGGAAAATLGACGTILQLADDPDGAASGDGSSDASSEATTTLDGSEVDLDAAVICPISADRETIVMGDVLVGKTHTETVRLKTTSTDARSVSFMVTGDGFSTSPPSPVTVMPGQDSLVGVTFATGGDATVPNATGTLVLMAADCAPITIPLSAKRSNSPFGVSPGTVDLGVARCGTAPAPATLSILSASDAGTTWTGSFPAGTVFNFSPDGGAVPPNTTTTIDVGATAVPTQPARVDSTFTLTIGAEAQARAVPVTVLSQGAALSFNPQVVQFAKAFPPATTDVKNTGNEAVTLTFVSAYYAFTPSKPFTLAAGATKTLSIALKTATPGPQETITPGSLPSLCVPGAFVIKPPP